MDVLLVDDEKELISTLAQRLSFRDITADWVTSGQSALASVKEKKYDIAVLDIKMPGISGLELAEKIKLSQPDIRIIFCTGQGAASVSLTEAVKKDGYITLYKPLDINHLIEKMNQLMD
jgi:DNA-binding NtrC family response regulator